MSPIHHIGHPIDIEVKGGKTFLLVHVLDSSVVGRKVVCAHNNALIALGLPTVANLPNSATCANCTHPDSRPDVCLRRPDEDHIVIGGTAGTMLDIFARRAKQVCPVHSAGE